ncbi:MAG: glycosyltransferase family 4 protein [Chthoniobacterales bacterium]
MILLSHPTGNANVRAVVEALLRHGMLFRFATCIGLTQQSGAPAMLARRRFDIPREKLWVRPFREMVRHVAPRLGFRSLVEHERGWASMDGVGRDLDRFVARELSELATNDVSTVYCYEDFAQSTFTAAKQRGMRCVYDLPIAAWETVQRFLADQARRWPAWEPTLLATRDSPEKISRKQTELELSDIVVTPSRFVLESLPHEVRANKRCVVVEFGSPAISGAKPRQNIGNEKLRLLFVGAMTQRKGLADLFAAMKLVDTKEVELIVLGSPLMPMAFYESEFSGFTYEEPREHGAVLELMHSCDVLVLPSIVEGRALVQQEAMACGLPLIVTRNAGGEDLIEEGMTGFLVPPNAPEAIAEKISWFLAHRRDLGTMSAAARAKAAELTWRSYGDKIVDAIAA